MPLRKVLDARIEGHEEPDRLADRDVLRAPALDDPFGEGLSLDPELRHEAGAQPGLHGAPPLLLGDPALLDHQPEDEPRAFMGALPRVLAQGVEAGRGLDHPGQHGGFVEVEVLRLLAEIVARGPVEADDLAAAELDLVEVGREHLVLADRAVEAAGMPQFGALALEAAQDVAVLQVVEDEVLEELHRDRAAAAVEAALEHRHEGDQVDPAMVEVALVLDRHDGGLHGGRDLVGAQDHRTAAIGVEAARRARHHHLGRGDEQPELLRREIPEPLRFGRGLRRPAEEDEQERCKKREEAGHSGSQAPPPLPARHLPQTRELWLKRVC